VPFLAPGPQLSSVQFSVFSLPFSVELSENSTLVQQKARRGKVHNIETRNGGKTRKCSQAAARAENVTPENVIKWFVCIVKKLKKIII